MQIQNSAGMVTDKSEALLRRWTDKDREGFLWIHYVCWKIAAAIKILKEATSYFNLISALSSFWRIKKYYGLNFFHLLFALSQHLIHKANSTNGKPTQPSFTSGVNNVYCFASGLSCLSSQIKYEHQQRMQKVQWWAREREMVSYIKVKGSLQNCNNNISLCQKGKLRMTFLSHKAYCQNWEKIKYFTNIPYFHLVVFAAQSFPVTENRKLGQTVHGLCEVRIQDSLWAETNLSLRERHADPGGFKEMTKLGRLT